MPSTTAEAGGAAAAFQEAEQGEHTRASPAPRCTTKRAGLPWHGVDLAVASDQEVDLPPVLRIPRLPEDPGLDGFAGGGREEEDGASERSAASPHHHHHHPGATNPFADPAPAPPQAAILMRAALTAWGGQPSDACTNLTTRVAYARWLAGRLGLRALDVPAALGAGLAAAGRTPRDLKAAAGVVRLTAALPGVYAPADWADDGPGKAAAAAWAGAEAVRLDAAAAAAGAAPPFAGTLRLTLLSYRPAARTPGEGGSGKLLPSSAARSPALVAAARHGRRPPWWACCVAPAALEGGGSSDDDEAGAARPRGRGGPPPRRRPAAYAQVWLHAPPPALQAAPSLLSTPSLGGSKKRGGGSGGGAVPAMPPPPPPPSSTPLFRGPTAKRGASAAWGVATPTLSVPGPGCGLEVRVCDDVRGDGGGGCAAGAARPSTSSPARRFLGRGGGVDGAHTPDPVIGTARLALADVIRAHGRGGGGGAVWALPLYSAGGNGAAALPPSVSTVGTPLVGGTPLLPTDNGPTPLPGAAAARGDLVGVVRVAIDFLVEERTEGGCGDEPAPPPSIPATSRPHAAFDELTTALWKDWRAARGELAALEREEEEAALAAAVAEIEGDGPGPLEAGLGPPRPPPTAEPRPGALPPPPLPPPPPDADTPGELPGVPGLAAVVELRARAAAVAGDSASTAAAAAAVLPGDAWLHAARGAAALLRVRPAGQQVALLRCALRGWADAVGVAAGGRPSGGTAAVGELAADLWAPLAAAARAGALTEREAAGLQAAGGPAVEQALALVEAYPRLWGGWGGEGGDDGGSAASTTAAGVRTASAALRLLALAVRWDDADVKGLAEPLAAHVRRAARRQMVAAAGASAAVLTSGDGADALACAAGAAVETAAAGLAADVALRPAFSPALDPAAVAGKVRYATVARLAAAALAAAGGDTATPTAADGTLLPPGPAAPPPAYSPAVQRLEDELRRLHAGLVAAKVADKAGASSPAASPRPISLLDVDALVQPALLHALWQLRPLGLEWVDRTLRPAVGSGGGGGGGGRDEDEGGPAVHGSPPRSSWWRRSPADGPPPPSSSAAAARTTWTPVSRATRAMYSHAVVDLYSLVGSAVDGLGVRAAARPRSPAAAAEAVAALAAALAPAPARMAALIEAAVAADMAAAAAAATTPSSSRSFRKGRAASADEEEDDGLFPPPPPAQRAGSGGFMAAWFGGRGKGDGPGDGSELPPRRAGPRPPRPAPPSPATGVKVSSLFELCVREADHETRLARLAATGSPDARTEGEGEGGEGAPHPPAPHLAVHAELAAGLAGAASRAVLALAARLDPSAEWLFARALDEASVGVGGGGHSGATPAAARVAALASSELATLAPLLSPAALAASARATAWVLVKAAETVLLAPGPPGAAPVDERGVTALVRAAEAGVAALEAGCVASDVPPPPHPDTAAALDRLGALGSLATAPTAAVEDAADELWAAAAARAAAARARSGLGTPDAAEGDERAPPSRRPSGTPPPPSTPPRRPGAAAPPGLAYLDAVRILQARAAGGDAGAGAAAALRSAHAASQVMTAVFGVPSPEAVVAAFTCRASTAGGARGTLYLSEQHVAFARDGAAGWWGGDAGGGGGGGIDAAATQAGAPLALIPLSSIRRAVRVRRRRSRGLAFIVAGEAEPAVFWGFEGGGKRGGGAGGLGLLQAASPAAGDGSRDAAEAALRLHVMGDGSLLDRAFRGLPPPGAPPGAPPDRCWEVRLAGGFLSGAWATLVLGQDGAALLSDEAPPVYSRYGDMVEARPASTTRDWRLSADVAVSARWAPLTPGAAAAAAGGGGLPPPDAAAGPPPAVSKLHLAGLGDAASEVVAELVARMDGAKAAAAGVVVLRPGGGG